MPRISYVNGRYVNHSRAVVHMEDRGYQFADGVYEVVAFYNRRLLDGERHLRRLMRSLNEMEIATPMTEKSLRLVMREMLAQNDREDGTLYMQITRGAARRDHPFPKNTRASLVMTVTGPKAPKEKEVAEGVSVITLPDLRWARRDIKSIALLPNVLAKQQAAKAGAREAWLLDEQGNIGEGAASNNAIVTAKGEIITSPADMRILGGITREVVLELARKEGLKVMLRPFSVKEAMKAEEAFLMSTTSNVLPVTRIDGEKIGSGRPGKTTLRLLALYREHISRETGKQ
jgi:D-alanine transaminase